MSLLPAFSFPHPEWSCENRVAKKQPEDPWKEWKSGSQWSPPAGGFEKKRRLERSSPRPPAAVLPAFTAPVRAPPRSAVSEKPTVDADEQLWSNLVQSALDGERLESTFELSRRNIKAVTPNVRDLRLMTRLDDGTKAAASLDGLAEIKLYLSSNLLTAPVISNALFMLHNLVVLSLRDNQLLEELPSGIGRLVNLRELNVGGCRLQHLPAELQSLTLSVLNLFPNPFMLPPEGTKADAKTALGPLVSIRRVPTLVEYCQRLLLQTCEPASPTSSLNRSGGTFSRNSSVASITGADGFGGGPCRVAHTLQGELSDLPAHLFTPFKEVMTIPQNGPAGFDALANICAAGKSPGHSNDSVFITPCETRLQFTRQVAGVELSSMVPVLWRGCRSGCLAWLEQ